MGVFTPFRKRTSSRRRGYGSTVTARPDFDFPPPCFFISWGSYAQNPQVHEFYLTLDAADSR